MAATTAPSSNIHFSNTVVNIEVDTQPLTKPDSADIDLTKPATGRFQLQ